MDRFRSLSARLVVTAVTLVAVVSLLIGTATTLALRSQLLDQLDAKVVASAHRGPERGGPGGPDGDDFGNQGPGTLQALVKTTEPQRRDRRRQGQQQPSPHGRRARRARLRARRREVHAIDVSGLGSYRVVAHAGRLDSGDPATLVTGLPTKDVDDTLRSLILTETLLALLAVLAAGGIGTVVVRRQLRPLREVAATAHAVAELPLATGAISLEERVPAHLTDERTEVGQVGSAINTMLEHVESSLSARHRSEQQVRQFVADASHELRTPLTTIAGYTELARRHPDDRAAADTALAKVEEESGRMTALVEDLLLLARLDAGRPLARDHVDLSRLLIEAVSDARVLAPDHQWRLELPDDSVGVTGDEQRLHQVVTNLLTNARKYTPPGTTVTVRAHPAASPCTTTARVSRRPGRHGVRALRPRRRLPVPRRRGGDGGYGLGLSLVHAVTVAHGGHVRLESTPGDTTVSVDLPRMGSVWSVTLPSHVEHLVVGAGFAGVALAIGLQDDGEEFLVIEKADGLGGTWWANTYPGATCDIPSHLYSFSFAPNPDWSHAYSPQAEILAYLEKVAAGAGVLDRFHFGVELLEAAWDDEAQLWRVRTSAGELTSTTLINATGGLSAPKLPDIEGIETFAGHLFHTAGGTTTSTS